CVLVLHIVAVSREDPERSVIPGHRCDYLILADIEFVVLGHVAVVLERLKAGWLLVSAVEGQVANLQQLRRGEKRHVRGVVEQRIDQAAFVHQSDGKAGALRLNGGCHSRGPGANNQEIKVGVLMCHEGSLYDAKKTLKHGVSGGSRTTRNPKPLKHGVNGGSGGRTKLGRRPCADLNRHQRNASFNEHENGFYCRSA